jgi:DNA-binding CsgD family transcriptional regulator
MKLVTSSLGTDALSLRQIKILHLLAYGLSNQEIGLELDLSAKTVRNQVCEIYASLGVSNRVHAARWAMRVGLAGLEPGLNEQDVLQVESDADKGASYRMPSRSAI